ncbi:hypothetical protein N9876_01745, partial [bacterium]|nr:hypothetical protein [bacterium]
MANATSAVSPLRRRMIGDMTLRNLSPTTQRSYRHALAKFSRYFDRSPDGGLLSYGNDMTDDKTPLECGLGKFCNTQTAIGYIGRDALLR